MNDITHRRTKSDNNEKINTMSSPNNIKSPGSNAPAKVIDDERQVSDMLDKNINFDEESDTEDEEEASQKGEEAAPEREAAPVPEPKHESIPKKSKKGGVAAKLQAAKKAKEEEARMSNTPAMTNTGPPAYGPATGSSAPPGYTRTVQGSNIGSHQNEPQWTEDQIKRINAAKRTMLQTEAVNDTRRTTPDPEGKYVILGEEDKVRVRPAAYLPNIKPGEYMLGYGRGKPDQKTGKSRIYSDIVMIGPNKSFVLNQWTIMDVIMEGVPQKILDKPARTGAGGRPERRIGHDFARVGLPAEAVGPIFQTMAASMPGLLDEVSITRGYYWLNASWGVTSNPGKFLYKGEDGEITQTTKLSEGMRRIMGYSSMGIATIAISVSDEMVMKDNTPVASGQKNAFSIKLHNMFHLKKTNYHSPPQASSTGFEISDDIFSAAETLSGPPTNTGAVFANTTNAFDPNTVNPFNLIKPTEPGNMGQTSTGFL